MKTIYTLLIMCFSFISMQAQTTPPTPNDQNKSTTETEKPNEVSNEETTVLKMRKKKTTKIPRRPKTPKAPKKSKVKVIQDSISIDLRNTAGGEPHYKVEIIKKPNGLYSFKAFNILERVVCKGTCLDRELTQRHGKFVFYFDSGQLESKGKYRNDIKIGMWKRYSYKGTEKSPRYYSDERYEMLARLKQK